MNAELRQLLNAFNKYRDARINLLTQLRLPDSCRDPLSEFSEALVAAVLRAQLAENRVQEGFDMITPTGERVEVKYLSNPSTEWRNWHTIKFTPLRDKYALVYYEDLSPKAIFVFPRQGLQEICQALGKRHDRQETELQFTKNNYRDLTKSPERFQRLGMQIILLE